MATLVDFHDGRRKTDADVVDIGEVYEDALWWIWSSPGVGDMTFDHACSAVQFDPEHVRRLISPLRTKITFRQFLSYQSCPICFASPVEVARWGTFLFSLCRGHATQLESQGSRFLSLYNLDPELESSRLRRRFDEVHANRV